MIKSPKIKAHYEIEINFIRLAEQEISTNFTYQMKDLRFDRLDPCTFTVLG